MDINFIWTCFLQLLTGLPLTLNLTFAAFGIGAFLAMLLTLLRMSSFYLLQKFVKIYVFIIRGTPLLIQIFLIYYGLGQFRPTWQALGIWSFIREPYWCAIIALTLNHAAYGSEVLRGGLKSVSRQSIEAAIAFGMSRWLTLRRIILPIALRNTLPAYGNELVLMVKATSLASTITLMDITGIAARLISSTYRSVEIFIAAGTIYLLITLVLTQIITFFDERLRG